MRQAKAEGATRALARLLVIGFEGTQLPEGTRALLAEGAGGVILFRRNIESAEQTRALIESCREAAGRPIWVGVDQEGGRVARLKGITCTLPPMRTLDTPQKAAAVGELLGLELQALGFNLNFAPVVDVDSNPQNPVIGDRAFSCDPAEVCERATAFIQAMQSMGVAACAKHFPGHGDTLQDSHLELPSVEHDLARLRALELPPFAAASRAGVATMMTAHMLLPALDPVWPATMSPTILALLREELGYDGLLFSDDLEMGAVADRWPVEEAGCRSVIAGVDQLLVCHRLDRQRAVIDALLRACDDGTLSEARLAEATRRIEAAMPGQAPSLVPLPLEALGSAGLQARVPSGAPLESLQARRGDSEAAAGKQAAEGRDHTGDR